MQHVETAVFTSNSRDPHVNLAAEEWLFRQHSGNRLILFLYRNRPAVVVGRNQNPWLEADLEQCNRHAAILARRISGGGTVYHDPGNLNYCFIMPRRMYEPTQHLRLILDVVSSYGIDAHIDERHNILAGDAKLSGSAFMLSGATALQHGTLLMHANLNLLGSLLTPPDGDISTKASRSVRSPVANLTDLAAGVTNQDLEARLADAFCQRYGGTGVAQRLNIQNPSDAALHRYVMKHRSFAWLYGRTPPFIRTWTLACNTFGKFRVDLSIRNARVESVSSPDGIPDALHRKIEKAVIGNVYTAELPGVCRSWGDMSA